ncbi:MAG: YCF48-related protein, partial [Bacteroidota bacterium]|nr:YCF48-related protein [Bacteroidota bacterium]
MKNKIFIFNTCILILGIDNIFSQSDLKWRLVQSAPYNSPGGRLDDASFINENTGWVITQDEQNNDYVYKTTNGGVTWDAFTNSSFDGVRCIGFADSLNGWLGTLSSNGTVLYNTTNGGLNWSGAINTTTGDSLGVCGISVVDKNNVYACGRYYGPPHLFKTTNGGINWTIKYLGSQIYTLIDCHFFNKDSGFVVGGIGNSFETRSGAVLFTSDGGDTWINRSTTPPRGQWCWKISFPERLTGYISLEKLSGSPVYFLKTTNGGETWTEKVFLNT